MENIFQRPPILMRLTMLTRDKMSLLRAASLRTARETAYGLNDRKQRGWVEAGILPLNYSRVPTLYRSRNWRPEPPQNACFTHTIAQLGSASAPCSLWLDTGTIRPESCD